MKPNNWFIQRFRYAPGARSWGIATYVKPRNGGASCYKWLTGMMSWSEAVSLARRWKEF